MKPYKLKRRQEEHNKKHPTKFKRQQELIKAVRLLATQSFNGEHQNYWYELGDSDRDVFVCRLIENVNMKLTCADVDVLYPIYVRCIELMDKKKEKDDFIQNIYVPLEEDLFHV